MRSGGNKLRAQNGNAILITLVGITALSGVMALILGYLPVLHQQRTKSQDLLTQSLALSSTLEYVKYSIAERQCVRQGSLLPDLTKGPRGCSTDLSEWATDEGNLERFILPVAALTAEVEGLNARLGRPSGDRTLLLGDGEKHHLDINRSYVQSADHPLHLVFDASPNVESVRVSIQRVTSKHLPSEGLSTYLKLTATMNGAERGLSSTVDSLVGSAAYAETVVGFHPRELNTFALIVPGNLRLDRGSSSGVPNEFVIPKVAKTSLLPSSQGLFFGGPVYVNDSLVIPQKTTGYSATTFADEVVLGSGRILQGNGGSIRNTASFAPASAGGFGDRFLAQLSGQFGGVARGVRMRGRRDLGLDYLFDLVPGGATASPISAMQCARVTQTLVDLELTKDSQHVIRSLASPDPPRLAPDNSPRQYRFQIGLTRDNRIMAQEGLRTGARNTPPGNSRFESVNVASSGRRGPVLRLRVDAGRAGGRDDYAEVFLDRNGDEANFQFKALSNADISSITSSLLDPTDMVNRLTGVRPRLTVRIENHIVEGKTQSRLLNVIVTTQNEFAFRENRRPKLTFQLFDLGYDGFGRSVRSGGRVNPPTPDTALEDTEIVYRFGMRTSPVESRALTPDSMMGDFRAKPAPNGNLRAVTAGPPNPNVNLEGLYETCTDATAGTEVAGFEQDFARQAKDSWHFAPADDADPAALKDYVFHSGNAKKGASPRAVGGNGYEWPVLSRLNKCEVRSNADFVIGFFTCNELVIEPRNTPLTIIGTFIVKRASIDPSAIRHGISWYSIHHPEAVSLLRQETVLGRGLIGDCERALNPSQANFDPVWHPEPSITNLSLYYSCFPSALRATADPFQWTQVDPDCARTSPTDVFTKCKRRPKEYSVEVVSFEDNVN